MDFVDILITLGIFAIFIGSEVLKIKKKMASSTHQRSSGKEELNEDFVPLKKDYFKEKEPWKNEKFTSYSSKSTTYFTYEDVSAAEEMTPPPTETKPSSSEGIYTQVSENEIETSNIDLQNPEELKKAIIYSEILKNPYN